MIRVEIKRKGEPPQTRTLDMTSAVVGRDAACDLVLDHRDVSRRQCRLFLQGDEVFIEPLGSQKLRVNKGMIAGPVRLGPDDVVSFGNYRMRLVPDERSTGGVSPTRSEPAESRRWASEVFAKIAASAARLRPPRPTGPEVAGRRAAGGAAPATLVEPPPWLREEAERWVRLGRPARLLLEGDRLRKAPAIANMEASTARDFLRASIDLRRDRRWHLGTSLVTVLVAASVGGALAGSSLAGEPLAEDDGAAELSAEECSADARERADRALEDAKKVAGAERTILLAHAARVADESKCGDLTAEREAREGLSARQEVVIFGERPQLDAGGGAQVVAIARAPDDAEAVVARSGDVRVFGWSDGKSREIAKGGVKSIAWSRDGSDGSDSSDGSESTWLALGGRSLTLWRRTGKDLAEQLALEGHGAPLTKVAFSPGGRWLASGDEDGEVRLWALGQGQESDSRGRARATGQVEDLAFDRGGERLFARIGGSALYWTIEAMDEGDALGKPRVLASEITALRVSSDGSRLLTGDSGGEVSLWEPAKRKGFTRQRIATCEGKKAIDAVAFVPRKETLLFACGGRQALIHLGKHMGRGVYPRTYLDDGAGAPLFFAVEPTGRRLVKVSTDEVAVWDIELEMASPVLRVPAPEGSRWASAEMPEWSGVVLLGDADGIVRGVDVFGGGGGRYTLDGHEFDELVADRAGDVLVARNWGGDGRVRSWRIDEHGAPHWEPWRKFGAGLGPIALAPKGDAVAGALGDQIIIKKLSAGEQEHRGPSLAGVQWLAYLPDEKGLIAASPNLARWWPIVGSEPARTPQGEFQGDGLLRGIAVGPKRLAAIVGARGVRVWNLDEPKRPMLDAMLELLEEIVMDESGSWLAARAADRVSIWRLDGSGAEPIVEAGEYTAVAFSRGGSASGGKVSVVVGAKDGMIKFRALDESDAGWEKVATSTKNPVRALAFGEGSTTVLSLGADGLVTRRRGVDGTWSLVKIAKVDAGASKMVVLRGGRAVAVLRDGVAEVWPVSGGALLRRACSLAGSGVRGECYGSSRETWKQ